VTVSATSSSTWTGRLARAVERDGAGPIVYFGVWAATFAILTTAQWGIGAQPVGTFRLIHAVIAAGIPVPILLIGVIDRSAARAMAGIRPLLAVSDEEAVSIQGRLVSTPPWLEALVAVVAGGYGAVRFLADPAAWRLFDLSLVDWAAPLTIALLALFVVSVSALFSKFLHLAVGIGRISRLEPAVSVWELGPLNGFAVLTAQIAATLIAAGVAFYVAVPSLLADPVGLLDGLIELVFAAAVFVVPLRGIHHRLVAEKGRLTTVATRRLETATEGLHAAIEAGDLPAMDAWNKAIGALDIELRRLAEVATWPWLPDTFRWVVGALMFPIVLFIAQFVITKLLAA